MRKDYICISCPIGCRLTLEDTGGIITVSGNKCPRGDVYAREEFLSPKRIVTATCKIGTTGRRLPVKTDKPVLKDDINGLLNAIYNFTAVLPVKCGDCLIENYNNSGINVISAKTVN